MQRAVSRPRIGVVAAAGKGRRIHPRSALLPKVMLEVAGKPLLTRNLELMRDALGVEHVVVIVGHLGERIRETYGDGSRLGLMLEYVENRDAEGQHREPPLRHVGRLAQPRPGRRITSCMPAEERLWTGRCPASASASSRRPARTDVSLD